MVSSTCGRAALLLAASALLAGCALVRPTTTSWFGAARTNATVLAAGEVDVPQGGRGSARAATVATDLIDRWAARPLPDWQEEGKVSAPRILLARLARGREVAEVNAYLQAAEPWAGIGSTWELRSSGDYDFSLPPLTAILFEYGERPEILYPQTREHLLAVLLNQEGGDFNTVVPGSLGLVTETENHILMTEGARYLKNQWLHDHGSADPRHDNEANGLEARLVEFIHELELAGPWEFNSHPYAGYTAMALLTLEAYAREPVAVAARSLLDRMNWEFALGSHLLRRYPVFRRQPGRAERTDLTDHPHTAMMRVWVSLHADARFPVEHSEHHAVYAALMPYRLPELIAQTALATDRDHYVRIGRGPGASPELYCAGPGYLISAGGTGRPPGSLIVARPITLFLDDDAAELDELFYLEGDGDHHEWNNTGVLERFAVARSPAHVPAAYDPVERGNTWSVYPAPAAGAEPDAPSVLVAVADTGETAALYVQENDGATGSTDERVNTAAGLLQRLEALAPAAGLDAGSVRLPDGRQVRFDLAAGPDRWVITAVDGRPVDRELTEWPRLSGHTTTLD